MQKSGHISVRFLFHNVQRRYNFSSRFVLVYPALSRLSCWMGWVFLKGFHKVTVYVPYEKWVEMIGGRDALAELAKYGTKSVLYDISKEERQKYPDSLIFGGVRYNLHDVTYKRVLIYYSYNNFNSYTKLNSILYYDWEAKTALYKYTWMPSNEASWISPSRLLGIRSGHDGCFPQNEPHYKFRNLYAPD